MKIDDIDKYEKIIKECDKALEEDPKDVFALEGKGSALSKLDRPQEAIKFLDKGLEIDSRGVEMWVEKGTVLKNLSKYQEAMQCYDRALEIIKEDYGDGVGHEVAHWGRWQINKLLKKQSTEK